MRGAININVQLSMNYSFTSPLLWPVGGSDIHTSRNAIVPGLYAGRVIFVVVHQGHSLPQNRTG